VFCILYVCAANVHVHIYVYTYYYYWQSVIHITIKKIGIATLALSKAEAALSRGNTTEACQKPANAFCSPEYGCISASSVSRDEGDLHSLRSEMLEHY
jgi:hypothetical protein